MKDFILHLRPRFTDEEKEKCIPTIEKIYKYADLARYYGLLAFEPEIENEESVFVKYIMRMVVDGVDKFTIKECIQIMMLVDYYEGSKLLDQLLYARGFLGILNGDNPRVIKEFLYAMLGEKYLERYLEEVSNPSLRTANEIVKGMKDKKVLPECAGFEKEILQLNRVNIQYIIPKIDYRIWACALRGCSAKLINDHFFDNVSQNYFIKICEDMDVMGDIRLQEILQAQKVIIDKIDELEKSGEIVLWHRCKKAGEEITNHDLNNPKEPADFDISDLEDGDLPF